MYTFYLVHVQYVLSAEEAFLQLSRPDISHPVLGCIWICICYALLGTLRDFMHFGKELSNLSA